MRFPSRPCIAAGAFLLAGSLGNAQGTLADYQRGQELARKTQGLVVDAPGAANWIGETDHFWYSKSVTGGTEFLLVDAAAATKKPAFDHEKLAAALSSASGKKYTALTLPFALPESDRAGAGGRGAAAPTSSPLTFVDGERSIRFGTGGSMWTCTLTNYACSKGGAIPPPAAGGRGAPAADQDSPEPVGGDPVDGLEYQPPPPQQGAAGQRFGRGSSGCAPRAQSQPQAQGQGRGGRAAAAGANAPAEPQVCTSFDGKWDALIQNFNVFLRPAGTTERPTALSLDGSEGNYYTFRSIAWSPDSKKLVAYHTRPGYDRQVHYIESSPSDQLQPKHSSIFYRKPGDALDIAFPALFDVSTKKETEIDQALFPNAYNLTPPVWWKDSRGFTFEYNQRGHQVYRVIEVDAETAKARALIDEKSPTFFYYNLLGEGLSGGRRYRHDLNDGKEIIWASERDGWEHLYLYDGVTGKVKNQITKGDWVVRMVDRVDEDKRQIWFQAGGMNPGQDPYFTHYYRINFDGTGLTRLTEADGNHTVTFSSDRKYYVDTWSRVDLPPVSQLRRAGDRKGVDGPRKRATPRRCAPRASAPRSLRRQRPRRQNRYLGHHCPSHQFRPGQEIPRHRTDLRGTARLLRAQDVQRRSPARRHSRSWDSSWCRSTAWAPATAPRHSTMSPARTWAMPASPIASCGTRRSRRNTPRTTSAASGIYGTSAGGQNSLGGVLFHPEFYKVVVTNSGCHDNRMDKIWWNEQWMGWPLGPQYAASSNVDNAYRLQGKALIIIGEMDNNVDPASSLQVVNALVKANKHFDMLFIPGQNHGVRVLASQHYLQDYFVHNLLGVEPPDWNRVTLPPEPSTAEGN